MQKMHIAGSDKQVAYYNLDANGILYAGYGHKRIGDNTLVALILMIADSLPEDKDIIIKVIGNLINRDNI